MRHFLGFAFALIALAARAQSATDVEVTKRIIEDSRQAYYATGHPCACPYDVDRRGHSCGRRSAYSRPGGAEPKCFPNDVTAGDLAKWRMDHAH